MWTQILSISSILLGLYLMYIFFVTFDFDRTSQLTEYHMGCFSTDNIVNHSISIREYLKGVEHSDQYGFDPKSFELSRKIKHKYNDISRSIAKDFEVYLHEKYQAETKNIYEKNFNRSLLNALQKFKTCNASLVSSFSPDECNSDWNNFLKSKAKYEELKIILEQKIQRKEQQQRKISYLILDTNYSDADEYQKNLTTQINDLNSRLEAINVRKIQILTKKSPIEVFIATNKTKLEEDEKLYDECIKNMKIITFCNELTRELNSIKLTFTKQDIQTKIQRKKFIIDSFKNAIRNAEKIGDKQMARISQESLDKNEKELGLLIASIQSFQSFEESYCSKCSDDKIKELKSQIQSLRVIITQLTTEYAQFTGQEEELSRQSVKVSQRISQIEEERDFHINSNICVTPECQEQRSKDIKELGKVLNEMKKEVLDYKFIIEEHKIPHANKIAEMDEWTSRLGEVVDCLHSRQYYYALRDKLPSSSKQLVQSQKGLRNSIYFKLESYGDFNKQTRIEKI